MYTSKILLVGTVILAILVLVFYMKINNSKNVVETLNDTKSPTATINNVSINLEVASSAFDKAEGLSGRESLEKNSGMLFPFRPKVTPIFWMIDMNFPLDMIWISEGKVIAISENAMPEPGKKPSELKKYFPPEPIDYILEVNGGFSKKNNIKVGDSVTFSGI